MTTPAPSEIGGVAGVAECTLSDHLVSTLPSCPAKAPWTCTGSAVLWAAAPSSAARRAVPQLIRRHSAALAVVGGFIRYDDTPVGSYNEVLGAIGFRRGAAARGHVGFMAVDSEASLVGGRVNWAMPKTLASFRGEIASKSTIVAESALKPWWSIEATPRVLGPAFPAWARAAVFQQRADGTVITATLRLRAKVRPAWVHVAVTSEGPLPEWLRPGHRIGVVIEGMTFTLAAATAVETVTERCRHGE